MEGRDKLGRFVKEHNLTEFSNTWKNQKEVVDLYSINKLTLKKIADKFNCSTGVICNILKKYNIKSRTIADYKKGKSKLDSRKNEIINLYNKGVSISKIARLVGCDEEIVSNLLHKNNIKIKTAGFYRMGISPSNKLNLDEKEVVNMYLKEDISGGKIAKHFNCDDTVIYDILNKHDIKMKGNSHFLKGKESPNKNRTFEEIYGEGRAKKLREKARLGTLKVMESESHRKRLGEIRKKGIEEGRIKIPKGEGHHFFNKTYEEIFGKEGAELKRKKMSATKQGILLEEWQEYKRIKKYGKDFNNRLKRAIKERDGCCMVCNIGFEDLKLLKRRIQIHHINYDKQISIPQNLISLCTSCHTKTNKNRKSWTIFFQSLLTEMYKYKYSEIGEIILEVKN